MSATIKLLSIAMRLQPGQAFDVPHRDMAEASIGDMPLLDRIAGPRPEDIEAFIAKVGPNWGVEFREKPPCEAALPSRALAPFRDHEDMDQMVSGGRSGFGLHPEALQPLKRSH